MAMLEGGREYCSEESGWSAIYEIYEPGYKICYHLCNIIFIIKKKRKPLLAEVGETATAMVVVVLARRSSISST